MALATAAAAQPILTIPDTTGRKGDTLFVPVSLSGLGADSLFSVQATVTSSSSHATVIGVSTSGTLTAGSSASYFSATRRLAVAMTAPITADGTLFYLQVALTGTPGQQTTLSLSSILLNEGTPSATVDPGVVRLREVTISPKYLSNVAVGDSVVFSATGDVVLPLAWSTSSASVGTIDSAGIFRAVAPGFVTVSVTDGEGKRDSTSSFNVVPDIINSLTLWIPDTSRMQTLEVDVPVRVTTVTGLGITSAQFRVTYSTSALQYLGIYSTGGLAETWGAPVVNDLTPGALDVAFAGADTLSGSGTLVWVRFRVKPTALGTTTIGLTNADFNETIEPLLDAGSFTALAAPLIKVNIDRAVALKGATVNVTSVTGGTPPFSYSSSNTSIATVDSSTGSLTVLTRGPVLIQTVDAQGFPGKSDTIRTYDFEAVVLDTSVNAGDSVVVPVSVGSTDGLGIVSYEFRLSLDTTRVAFRGLDLDGTLSHGWTVDARDSSGVVLVAAAGTAPASGTGVLFGIRLAASASLASSDSISVELKDLRFNEPGSSTPLALSVPGKLKLLVPNAAPVFTSALGDTTIFAGSTLQFTYIADDPDGDTLYYSIHQGPSFAMIDSLTGVLTLAALLTDVGSYPLEVRASDGLLSSTTSAVVTVEAANTASLRVDGAQDRARILDASPVNPSAVPSAYQISGSAITVESWVYLMDLPGVGAEYQIVARGAQSSFGVDPWFSYALRVDHYGAAPRFNFWLSTGTPGEVFGATADTVSVQTGRWYHIAGTYDGTTSRIYVDGELKKEEASGGKLIGSGTIGFYIGGTTYGYFNGLIDEVRLWNVTRTGPQISGAKDAALVGNEAGLAGYWPLDSTYYDFGTSQITTPDRSANRNDLVVQFDAKMLAFPAGSTVQFAPTNLSLLPFAIGGGYAVTGAEYRSKLVGDGWPAPTVTVTSVPSGATIVGDSVNWTPSTAQYGMFEYVATMTNTAGSVSDTVAVYVEAMRTASNLTTVDLTHRGKAGAFGRFGKGLAYNGWNGLYAADFSLVDRNAVRYAGGLNSTVNPNPSFRPIGGFTDVASRFPGFNAFSAEFTDENESSRIGVRVFQVAHTKATAPDDRYTIVEYRIVNESGSAIDDLFAQLTADFDIGIGTSNAGGYDASRALSYGYESGAATNSHYYGIQLLGHVPSGAAVFLNGTDPQYVRSTANLTTFPAIPGSPGDTRNQLTAGPFALAANETISVAFAYLAAGDLTQLQQAADAAIAAYATPGPENTASILLDGEDDRARVLDSSPVNPSANPSAYQISGSNISLEAWVYLMDLPGPTQDYHIVARAAQGTFGVDPYFSYALRVDMGSGSPQFNFWLSTGVAGEMFGAFADTVAVQTGRWYHVAGTYDGSNVKIYVDGELKSVEPFAGKTIGAGATGFYVGGSTYGHVRGLIDDVRLWNVARSAAQIAASRTSTLVGDEIGLAGYWPLDSTYYDFPTGQLTTPDRTVNHNDLVVQFDAKMVGFPAGSTVQFAPTNLMLTGPGDPTYTVTGADYRVKAVGEGWPRPDVTVTSAPSGSVVVGDSIIWTPAPGQWGIHPVIATITNLAGSVTDTVQVFVEEARRAVNLVGLDVTNRGKAGAFSSYGKGMFYGSKNGLGGADFSLVDRNDARYAGGLYSTLKSFRMLSGFSDVPGRWTGFASFATSFDDAWESPRIGVRITQTTSVKSSDPDDRYVINEYRVVNTSGVAIDDLFAQLTADFDVGESTANRGGYDSTLALSYAYEEGGATNSAYYGIVLLGRPVAGHAVFVNGTDPQYVRATNNLTTFPAIPASASDIRNQLTVGPLSIASGDSVTVAYAFVAADDLDQLRVVAQRARTIYAATAPTFASVTTLAVPGAEYRRRVSRNGTEPTMITAIALPAGATLVGDTLVWTPTDLQLGFRRVILEATNIAGTVRDTTDILVEAVRTAENQIRVDLTNRGKVGAFGQFGKGIWYKGKNGSGAADFSLVDRNSVKYAGGLYSTLFSFSPDGPATSSIGFIDTTSRIPGFTAFRTSFSDQWEPSATRIGVNVRMLGYVKATAPDDQYVIVEYNVINSSGGAIDDLFAQMTADFDIGNAVANLGGYDAALGLSYAHEQGGGTDVSYYGVALLSHPVAGHAVFLNGSDAQYVRSVANLTTFPAIPGAAGDTRNQLTAGPFALAAGDTLRFGVAFLAADDLTQLQAAAQQARTVWGNFTTSVAQLDLGVPAEFEVAQNYPNPFNPSTVIRFGLPTESRVSVTIYDQLGREVSTLVNGSLSAGVHEARWDASGMASGLYFFRIEAVGADGARFVRTNKMVLMK